MKLTRNLFYFCSVLSLFGCQKEPDAVLATVGNETVSSKEFQRKLQAAPAPYQQFVTTPEGQKQFLDSLIKEKILVSYARKQKLNQTKEAQEILKGFRDETRFQIKSFEDRFLVDAAIKDLREKKLKLSEADLKSYYESHRSDYVEPTEIRASHILIQNEGEGLAALERLKKGESFSAVARSLSKDPASAARGGELAPFRQGQLVPEFEEAAQKLKVGEISSLVKSRFGFHIIKKLAEKKLPAQSFEEAKIAIQNRFEKEKFDQWITEQEKRVKNKVDPKALENLVAPFKQNQLDKGVKP